MSGSSRSVATASNGDVAQAAVSALAHGNAVDAVVTGVFAAAALSPSVLLGPVQILIGGAGAGLRAIDGRTRQPGLDVPRPRGFRDFDPIPDAARVGVPALPAALAAALATCGGVSLTRAMGPALELARGSAARKKFLKRLAQRGPSYFTDEAVSGELLAVAGRVAGGVLTTKDLDAVRPTIVACEPKSTLGLPAVVAPWAAEVMALDATTYEDASHVQVVTAADDRGLVAIACYEVHSDGVAIEELGLEAPPTAAPVLRGHVRTKPGEPRPCASPMVLLATDGYFDVALGMTAVGTAERLLTELARRIAIAPTLEAAIRAPRAPHEGTGEEAAPFASDVGLAIGVVRSKRSARALSDPRRV